MLKLMFLEELVTNRISSTFIILHPIFKQFDSSYLFQYFILFYVQLFSPYP